MANTRRGPLNLAELVPELPEVILPSGAVVQVIRFTGASYEKYRKLQRITNLYAQGEQIDENAYLDLIDEVLAMVVPTASPDDLASFGANVELKLGVIAVAAGRVDEIVQALEEASPKAKVAEGNE